MADLLGIIAASLQLVELSAKTLAKGYGYLSNVANAPTEIQQLLRETAGLNFVLGQLHSIAAQNPENPYTRTALLALENKGVFTSCQELLEGGNNDRGISGILESYAPIEGHRVRNMANKMAWPLKHQKDVTAKLQSLSRLVRILSIALEADTAQSTRRIENLQATMQKDVEGLSVNIQDHVNHTKMERVLSWLCPVPKGREQKALQAMVERRHPGTCQWIIQSAFYSAWVASSDVNFCWITGLAGIGKSVLCATIIEHLQSSVASPEVIVAYLFCGSMNQGENVPEHMQLAMSLAAQFISHSQNCLDIASQKREDCHGRPLTFDEYLNLIKSFIRQYERVFFAIDGLDELLSIDGRSKELVVKLIEKCLPSLSTSAPGEESFNRAVDARGAKVILTSREDQPVRAQLACRKDALVCSLRLDARTRLATDLGGFISSEVQQRVSSGSIKLRNKGLAEKIRAAISQKAGTFLQAHQQLGIFTTTRTDAQVKAALERLPQGLFATYGQILETTIQNFQLRRHEIKSTLEWLVAAIRPMTAEQIAEVISLQDGVTTLDFDDIAAEPNDLFIPLSHLVAYFRSKGLRETGLQSRTVVLLHHFTVKEFLTSNEIQGMPAAFFHIDKQAAHAAATEKCLQFLSLSNFDEIQPHNPTDIENALRVYQFLEYATVSWATHMRLSGLAYYTTGIDRLHPYLQWFLDPDDSKGRYALWSATLRLTGEDTEHACSPLAYAIAEGLHSLVEVLLQSHGDLNRHFSDGTTCLYIAASNNNLLLATRLLHAGAAVDLSCEESGHTALHGAAEQGHEEMVRLLLQRGASPHARSYKETTPFYRAARGGSTSVLRLLREAGSEIDALTYDAWTPLMEAVESGHIEATRLLLSWGANPKHCSEDNNSPLGLASARHQSKELVHMVASACGVSPESVGRHEDPFQDDDGLLVQ